LLPKLKPGILSPSSTLAINKEVIHTTNLMYAKNYSVVGDIVIIAKNFAKLIRGSF